MSSVDVAMTRCVAGVAWLAMLVATNGGLECGAQAADLSPLIERIESDRISAVQRASASTLAIFGTDRSSGGGSGVLISSDGFALTNFHVVQPCGNHLKCGLNDGQLYDAVVVGIDPTGDLALIKLIGREDFPPAEIGDSNRLKVGEECFAVGNPFLLATDLNPTVTYGVVSGVQRYQPPAAVGILEYTDCIQTDAAINPGNSGGPLFNSSGQLIGINGRGSFEKRGRVNVGVGYAISIQQALNFVGVLRSGRVVDHATLGATVATDDDGRVVITNILDASDAFRRGIRYGDEIVSVWGRPIDTANTFKNVLGILPRGWRVPVVFRRDGESFEVDVRLAGVHSPEVLLKLSQNGGDLPRPRIPDGKGEEELPDQDRIPAQPNEPSEGKPDTDEEQKPSPRERIRRLRDRIVEKPKLPADIEAIFEQRHGYANYYFNRSNRKRVWQSFSDATSATNATGSWTLAGRVDGRGGLRVTLGDNQLFAQSELRNDPHERVSDLSEGLDQQAFGPADSGGLYVALHLWRRLVTLGPTKYGEVYYWGEAPLPDRTELYDVLVATHDIIESRFYFSRQTGLLEAMETYPDVEVDPCEIYFSDYRQSEKWSMPHALEVRFGNELFGIFTLNQLSVGSAKQGGT